MGAIVLLPEVGGSWLVLENMDCDYRFGSSATSALVSQLTALRPGDELKVVYRSKSLCVGVGFRLLATQTLRESEKNETELWALPGGRES